MRLPSTMKWSTHSRRIDPTWSDPKGSRGEGMVLLRGGHLLVAKEKKPAAFH